jgi:hypothetical protein
LELSRSRQFFNLAGPGRAPHVWEAAVRAQLTRIRAAREDVNAYFKAYRSGPGQGRPEPLTRIEYEIHFLLVAIRNTVRVADALQKLVGPGELADAIADFKQQFPHAGDFRDYTTHFGDYARGKGRHQKEGEVPVESQFWQSWWGENDDLRVFFGDRSMDLDDAAAAAVELAKAANRAWLEGFSEAMEAEADAAGEQPPA